jgi:hypothetical protein
VTLNTNVAVEFVTLLLGISEVSCSDTGPEIDYPEVSRDFPQYLQVNAGMATRIKL